MSEEVLVNGSSVLTSGGLVLHHLLPFPASSLTYLESGVSR